MDRREAFWSFISHTLSAWFGIGTCEVVDSKSASNSWEHLTYEHDAIDEWADCDFIGIDIIHGKKGETEFRHSGGRLEHRDEHALEIQQTPLFENGEQIGFELRVMNVLRYGAIKHEAS